MLFRRIMTLIARIHFRTARKPEPAEALFVVGARAAVGEWLARVQAQALLLAARARRRREELLCAGGVGEKLDVGQREGEAGVAVAADVCGGVAAD